MNCLDCKENCCQTCGTVQLLQDEYDKILTRIVRNSFNHKQFGEIHFISTKDNTKCPFVEKGICKIYVDRPWVCRAFPVAIQSSGTSAIYLCYSEVCRQISESITRMNHPGYNISSNQVKEMILYEMAFSLATEISLFRMQLRMVKRFIGYQEKTKLIGLKQEKTKRFIGFTHYQSTDAYSKDRVLFYAIAREGQEVVQDFLRQNDETQEIIATSCFNKHESELERHFANKKEKLNDISWRNVISILNGPKLEGYLKT